MDDCRMAANDVVINNQVLRLVINLDRSPKRLESISKQLADQSLSFERFPAVDGHKLTKEELSRLEAPYNAPEKFVFRKALWPNEIACFLSHAACWEKLVKSDCEWGLIMEDDIVLSLRFKEALQKPLLPSRMEQKCSVQFFLTTPGGAVFYQHNSKILL